MTDSVKGKFTYQIRTGDFEYIMGEFITNDPDEAVRAYKELKQAYDGGTGISQKDWCRFLDCYLGEGKPPVDGMSLWQDMNEQQRLVVNEVKKCIKRINK